MVFAWDGFWQAAPSDQQLRLATYALRMLGSAAMSYAAASPAVVESARRRDAPSAAALAPALASKPAWPHYVRACLVSACLQLLATRPQYLPAVEAFLAHCSASCPELQLTLLNGERGPLPARTDGVGQAQPRPLARSSPCCHLSAISPLQAWRSPC